MRLPSMPQEARDDDSGLGVVDAHGKFMRSEAPKNDGMHGTKTRAGEHRYDGFRNHGHVDHDPVTLTAPCCASTPAKRATASRSSR